MSYSFAVKALTKAALLASLDKEFGKVTETQPVHAADLPHAMTAAMNGLSLLQDGEGMYHAQCHGSISQDGYGGPSPKITSVNISVTVSATKI